MADPAGLRPAPPAGYGRAPAPACRSRRTLKHEATPRAPAGCTAPAGPGWSWWSAWPGSWRASTWWSSAAAERSSAAPTRPACPCRCWPRRRGAAVRAACRPPSNGPRGWGLARARRRTTCSAGSPRRSPARTPTEELPARMAMLLAEGTGAQWAQVWLSVSDRLTLAATWPADADADRTPPALRPEDAGCRRRRAREPCRCARRGAAGGAPTAGAPRPAAHRGRGAAVHRARGPGGLVLRLVGLRADLEVRRAELLVSVPTS